MSDETAIPQSPYHSSVHGRPVPWRLGGTWANGVTRFVECGPLDDPSLIADVRCWRDEHGKPDDARRDATARLIAAAPELLDACCAVLAWGRGLKGDGPLIEFPKSLCESAVAKALAQEDTP